MESLLEWAINQQEGALEQIQKRLPDWEGKLTRTQRWQELQMMGLYSNDLRVRAATIEINLVVEKARRDEAFAENLILAAESDPRGMPGNEWVLGMLANRGVETDRIRQWLEKNTHDPDQQTRYWAVEGLAHIGQDETIPDFLDVLKNDASMDVRERAGCSLAKSGMLTREQRMKAVPGLLDLADDTSLDNQTRTWVFQDLAEITDVQLPPDPAKWREWYQQNGQQQTARFHKKPNELFAGGE
jgi:HEAT repeat protein